MPDRIVFKDVVDFFIEIRTTAELSGSTEAFEQELQAALNRFRAGLNQDHPLDQLRMHTPLGPHAQQAFEDFKTWYASWRKP